MNRASDYVPMPVSERAAALVGDMPWVTMHLPPERIADLKKQIATCIHAAIETAAITSPDAPGGAVEG
jgi:hypothetical protein